MNFLRRRFSVGDLQGEASSITSLWGGGGGGQPNGGGPGGPPPPGQAGKQAQLNKSQEGAGFLIPKRVKVGNKRKQNKRTVRLTRKKQKKC